MLPEHLFLNPVLTALHTTHAHLALAHGEAIRYRPDVSPFATVTTPTPNTLRNLHSLLTPEELIWVSGLPADLAETGLAAVSLTLKASLPCHQMFLPTTVPIPPPDPRTVPLTLSDVPAMIALTDVAFPGFFRPRTCEMGHYYGMPAETSKEELIAIAGERFTFPGYSEISCVCTHPSHRGQGLATSLIWEVARRHRREGIVSWLHVAARNQNALNLYRKLGFQIVRTIPLHQISRSE